MKFRRNFDCKTVLKNEQTIKSRMADCATNGGEELDLSAMKLTTFPSVVATQLGSKLVKVKIS
jgi:hypothetical protein